MSLTPGTDPVRALFWSAVLNGLVAVPVMVKMNWVAGRTDVMGSFAVRGWLRILGWMATLVMTWAAAGMIWSILAG